MQTGVITPDNLSQILRSISQRRRQGILEITSGDEVFGVHFIQGKIIDVIQNQQPGTQEVVEIFQRAGYLASDEQYHAVSYAELLAQITEKSANAHLFDEEVLAHAVRQRVLDKLYSLDLKSGAYYSFVVQMIEGEPEFLPSITVGQLLLDLVELESEADEWQTSFLAPGRSYVCSDSQPTDLKEDEQRVWDAFSEPTPVEVVQARTMLSLFPFGQAMASLVDKGFLSLVDSGESDSEYEGSSQHLEADLSAVDDIVAFLEDSIDESFSVEPVTVESLEPTESGETKSSSSSQSGEEFEIEHVKQVDSDQEEEEDEDAIPHSGLVYYNSRLLHNNWVPNCIICLMWIAIAVLPYLFWGKLIRLF